MSLHKIYLTIMLTLALSNSYSQYQWAKSYGGPSQDICKSMITDDQDNIYLTGEFRDTVDFDPTSGVDIHTSNDFYTNIFIQKIDPNGNVIWSKTIGGKKHDQGRSIVLDQQGNIYVSGYYADTVDFDPGPGIFEMSTSNSQGFNSPQNTFVLKLDNNGDFEWARTIGGDSPNTDSFWPPELSIVGNEIVVVSTFAGVGDLDSGPGIDMYDTQGSDFPIIVKFNLDGIFMWSKIIESNSLDGNEALFVEGDLDNNLYITGYYKGTVDFNPSLSVNNLMNPSNDPHIFILKLNSLGEFIWVKELNSTDYSQPNGLKMGQNNILYLVGLFTGTTDFDTGIGVTNITSIDGDHFICKMDTSGNISTVNIIATGTIWDSYIYDMSISVSGHIHLAGYFGSELTFDPIINPTVYTTNSGDGFLLVLDSNADFNNLKLFNTETSGGTSIVTAITSDTGDNVIISIAYTPDMALDILGTPTIFFANGELDVLILKENSEAGKKNLIVNDLIMYPNPTTGTCFINQNGLIEKLEIVDTHGRTVNAAIDVKSNKANISGLYCGVYFINVTSSSGNIQVRKLVVQ